MSQDAVSMVINDQLCIIMSEAGVLVVLLQSHRTCTEGGSESVWTRAALQSLPVTLAIQPASLCKHGWSPSHVHSSSDQQEL